MDRQINICHFKESGNTIVSTYNRRTGVRSEGTASDGLADLERLYKIAKLDGVKLAIFA